MRFLGRTERRLVLAILIAAAVPLLTTIFVGRTIIRRISSTAFQPEFGQHLERALGVYQDLTRAIKQGMRAEADAIAAAEPLRAAAILRHGPSLEQELGKAFERHPQLVSIEVLTPDGEPIGRRDRGRPVDAATERALTVQRPLGEGGDAPLLTAVFATGRARFDEVEAMTEFAGAYQQMASRHRAQYLERTYAEVLASLLGITVLVAVVAGVLLARPVTRRLARLSAATKAVAAGDLGVRVGDRREDELGDLGRAFDSMLAEMEEGRARIEYLRRLSAWQEMARRLAHEIKNPLTPIQLAVQECHRRYDGGDPGFRKVLETTLEVVEEEVGTLRRLVGEFSAFARLPQAELRNGDLAEFLRDQAGKLLLSEERPEGREAELAVVRDVVLSFDVPDSPMPAALDREMLRRVLVNVVRNAAQAIRDARIPPSTRAAAETTETVSPAAPLGRVRVTVREEGEFYRLDVDDDGPGVDPALRAAIFDPYVTTKGEGTGLGLAIVQKIVVDHGGSIEATTSDLGGARFRIRIPRAGTPAGRAALERRSQAGTAAA